MGLTDDGKHDPFEIKIENHPRGWNDQLMWEREFKQMDKGSPKVKAKRFRDRLWVILMAIEKGQIY